MVLSSGKDRWYLGTNQKSNVVCIGVLLLDTVSNIEKKVPPEKMIVVIWQICDVNIASLAIKWNLAYLCNP